MKTDKIYHFMPIHSGFLSIAGIDAKKLLQGQLTCDLETISATHSSLGAHCNPQGRVISLFRILFFEGGYLLEMPQDLIPIAMAAIKKYAVFFKVSVEDVSGEFESMGFKGNDLEGIFPKLPENDDEVVGGDGFLIVKVPGERFEIIAKKAPSLRAQPPPSLRAKRGNPNSSAKV